MATLQWERFRILRHILNGVHGPGDWVHPRCLAKLGLHPLPQEPLTNLWYNVLDAIMSHLLQLMKGHRRVDNNDTLVELLVLQTRADYPMTTHTGSDALNKLVKRLIPTIRTMDKCAFSEAVARDGIRIDHEQGHRMIEACFYRGIRALKAASTRKRRRSEGTRAIKNPDAAAELLARRAVIRLETIDRKGLHANFARQLVHLRKITPNRRRTDLIDTERAAREDILKEEIDAIEETVLCYREQQQQCSPVNDNTETQRQPVVEERRAPMTIPVSAGRYSVSHFVLHRLQTIPDRTAVNSPEEVFRCARLFTRWRILFVRPFTMKTAGVVHDWFHQHANSFVPLKVRAVRRKDQVLVYAWPRGHPRTFRDTTHEHRLWVHVHQRFCVDSPLPALPKFGIRRYFG